MHHSEMVHLKWLVPWHSVTGPLDMSPPTPNLASLVLYTSRALMHSCMILYPCTTCILIPDPVSLVRLMVRTGYIYG